MSEHLKEILNLPLSERIQIVEEIWDSINEEATDKNFELSNELKNELDIRSKKLKEGKTKSYSVDDVIKYIRTNKS